MKTWRAAATTTTALQLHHLHCSIGPVASGPLQPIHEETEGGRHVTHSPQSEKHIFLSFILARSHAFVFGAPKQK